VTRAEENGTPKRRERGELALPCANLLLGTQTLHLGGRRDGGT
jgi:hypothetical protein